MKTWPRCRGSVVACPAVDMCDCVYPAAYTMICWGRRRTMPNYSQYAAIDTGSCGNSLRGACNSLIQEIKLTIKSLYTPLHFLNAMPGRLGKGGFLGLSIG